MKRICRTCDVEKTLDKFPSRGTNWELNQCKQCRAQRDAAGKRRRYRAMKELRQTLPVLPRWKPEPVVIVGAKCLACDSVTFGVPCRHRFVDMAETLGLLAWATRNARVA